MNLKISPHAVSESQGGPGKLTKAQFSEVENLNKAFLAKRRKNARSCLPKTRKFLGLETLSCRIPVRLHYTMVMKV